MKEWVSSHYFAIGGVDMRSQVGVVKEDVLEDFLKSVYKSDLKTRNEKLFSGRLLDQPKNQIK